MKITLGDDGSSPEEAHWLAHGFEYTSTSDRWLARHVWVGWGRRERLVKPGWTRSGSLYHLVRHWGPLWVVQAFIPRRPTPLNVLQASPSSDEHR